MALRVSDFCGFKSCDGSRHTMLSEREKQCVCGCAAWAWQAMSVISNGWATSKKPNDLRNQCNDLVWPQMCL